jgi:hypothetical protein
MSDFEIIGAESQNAIYSVECVEILEQLKSEYLKEEGKNGKTE